MPGPGRSPVTRISSNDATADGGELGGALPQHVQERTKSRTLKRSGAEFGMGIDFGQHATRWRGAARLAKATITFETVRQLALTLSDVTVATAYGSPALKVKGNLLACVPANKSAEPGSAVFIVDKGLRAALLESKPEIYYLTDHYAAYSSVLVRLSKISRRELRSLLGMAWSFVAAKKAVRKSKAKSTRGGRPG